MRATAAQPSAGCARARAARAASSRRAVVVHSVAAAARPLALARRPTGNSSSSPRLARIAAASASAETSPPSTPSTTTTTNNPRPPAGTTAAYGALALAHAAAALALAALALLPINGAPPLVTSCLALGPASSLMAPALGACLAAASARAAGLSLFVRSAAAAAEGVVVGGGGGSWAAKAATKAAATSAATSTSTTTTDEEDAANDDDNDVTALLPLPTELRTWRYQRPNAALLAFGVCSAAAHALGLATAALGGGAGGSAPILLILPLLGLALSVWTALVAARGLRWAVVEASSSSPPPPSGALANVAFACEPLAEALGGAEDVLEDRRIVAAELQRQRDLDLGLRVKPADVAAAEAAAEAAAAASSADPRPIDPLAAARACLAYLARDVTTFQGLALTLTWVASLGCFAAAVLTSVLPWPRPLPAVAAAVKVAAASASSSPVASTDPALAYLLAAAGVAALPLIAGHAHALCEHAAYTRRLDVPGTLRATLLARLTRVARRRRVLRGREARGLVAVAAKDAVVDVRLDGGGDEAAVLSSSSATANNNNPKNNPAPLFPPPPHNAPPSRFAALRASFAAASALQLIGLVGIGASTSAANSDPRFVSAQAAARAALDAADPALAALSWACLLGLLWSCGQAFGFDFAKARSLVAEVAQVASKVVDLVVRGLFWDAYWVMQNRVVH